MSPTIFKKNGYRFFFFSREEPRMHVHIVSAEGEAKFWLEPEVALARSCSLSNKSLKTIRTIVEEHYDELIEAWKNHFRS